jgi:glycerol-3-phosphate dehydrogenase subunit B
VKKYDVMVIGSGFAGMAAALFAANAGLSVVQTGATGGIDFSTGFIDLLAVHPIAMQRVWADPFAALDALRHDLPAHPYGRVTNDEIVQALESFTTFLGEQGLCYTGRPGQNSQTLTASGTLKPTYLLPCAAWGGVEAMESRAKTLIVDFHGLKGLSAKQIVAVRGASWPGLRAVRVRFPGLRGELYPEHMAWSMADPPCREELAAAVAPLAGDAECIGFPAMLGVSGTSDIVAHLEKLLGRRVFEIPTLPPSIAGPRLRAAFDRGLPTLGVRTCTQKLVSAVKTTGDEFLFTAGSGATGIDIVARGAILASGRFFGKGLKADRHRIHESVFHLPVHQPESRGAWHRPLFFDPRGHEINQAGLETDARLRPLGVDGAAYHPRLHAAGAILAHQDWMRMKCGAGLAIATAWKAVQELRAAL